VKEARLAQLKGLAYYHWKPLKEVLEEALSKYVKEEPIAKALKVYKGK
jgi:hypothetical protein